MNVLVISPHPDDETLGAGGTLLRLKKEKHSVFWLNVTCISEQQGYSAEAVKAKSKQIQLIEKAYSFDGVKHLNFPAAKLGEVSESAAIKEISEYISEIQAEWVFIPDFNDAHSDHTFVFDWCLAATKSFRHKSVKRVMTMEILSETNFGRPEHPFVPNFYFDISDTFEKKKKIMEIYQSETAAHPFPRSLRSMEALATLRGSEANTEYAEAFRALKIIE